MPVLEAAAFAVSLIGLPIINKSIQAAFKYAAHTNQSNKTLSTSLENLAKQLQVINKTLHQAQQCFINKGEGEEILWGLKGAIDEAEEILDLFEYESLQNKPKGISFKFALEFTKGSPSRLEKVVKKLDKLGQSAQDFIIHDSPIFHGGRDMGPFPKTDFFFGYGKQHRKLKDLLKSKQKKVIAIIGHGGMGKTHLARQVFHDKECKFDVRIWAHVCNKTSERDLLIALCESALNKSDGLILQDPMDNLSVAVLQSKLEGLLKPPEKSCLVVLDDVWQHEDDRSGITRNLRDEAWMRVLARFKDLENCKVVMTTRDKVCSTTLNAEETIVLNGISNDSMSKLLEDYIATLPQNCKVVLPQRTARKLKGSPRAAVSIVDQLKTATKKGQRDTILKDLYNEHHIKRLYEDHLFTFRHLPRQLQSCLAFCSIFPFEWRFQREQLTKMWVAHGIIGDTEEGPHQDVAEGYFQDLVDRSLFKKVKHGRYESYEIHVHIHSMLRKVSRNECLSISNGSSSSEITVPATVRHLSVTASCLAKLKPAGPSLEKVKQVQASINKKKSDDEFRTVRTLLVFSKANSAPSSPWSNIGEANRTLRKFKGVKVLDLTATGITKLPHSVGELKHLRYLGFPNTVEQPPADKNEITKLLLLETVYVSKSQSRVDMKGIAKIGGIGHLEKLQGSLEFHIHNKKGHTMSELAKMNSLRTLSIKGIRAVATKEEAQKAHLEMKASLQVLKLDWELNQNKNSNADGGKGKGKGNGGAAAAAVSVLEGLQPHANLLELHITRYPGKDLPKWLCDMKNLTTLYLTSCTELVINKKS